MCYMIVLATDSTEDLSRKKSDHLNFSSELPGLPQERFLSLDRRWFVEGPESCSCGFRHLSSGGISLGFGAPESWYPEAPEYLEATHEFIGVVRSLLASGSKVECIDVWCDQPASDGLDGTLNVDLREINDDAFRFFENHHFVFSV